RHLRLADELALGAHLARHPRHFRGERIELVHHRVDGALQLQDLALHVHRDLLRQVAFAHLGGHLGHVEHLACEVRRHRVHVVGLPYTTLFRSRHLRLADELALGAHLARHARHLAGERIELVHHRVDGALQLQDLALHVHRDLLRQVALGHRGGHLGNVAHLAGEVRRHRVHVVGELLPGAHSPCHLLLPAELAVGDHPAPPSAFACPPSLPSSPTSPPSLHDALPISLSWSTIVLMVLFSSRISPFTSTVIFFDRSPLATAVVTSAMLRTWPVRFAAIAFTLWVSSFQVPTPPATCSCPPSLPSVTTPRPPPPSPVRRACPPPPPPLPPYTTLFRSH